MKIKKNGKVINLTESDLKRIVKKVLVEQALPIDPAGGIGASIEASGLSNILQGEHDIINKILSGDLSIEIVVEKLKECFLDLPAKCKGMNIVQDDDCQLKLNLDCISTKI